MLFPFSNIKRDNSCYRHNIPASQIILPFFIYSKFVGFVFFSFELGITYVQVYWSVKSGLGYDRLWCIRFQCHTLRLLFIYCMIVKRKKTLDILQIFWYRQGDLEPKFRRMIIYNAFTIILLCVCGNLYFHNILRKKTSWWN